MANIDEFLRELRHKLPENMLSLSGPYTARMYCPWEHEEAINKELESIGWGKTNLSQALSPTGRPPHTYRSGNYAGITEVNLRILLEVFSRYPGSCCVITPSDTQNSETIGIFGSDDKTLLGRQENWRSTAQILLGVRPSDEGQWLNASTLELILQTVIIPDNETSEGALIKSIPLAWLEIATAIDKSSELLFEFTHDPRKFEEFLAATYERAGYEVVLTPRSADRGRDVIASKRGIGSIRILDQAKAYKSGHRVTHHDVRAMLGVLTTDRNASKGVITTTSTFQTRIAESPEFKPFMPFRLQLVDGSALRDWIRDLSRT